MLRLAAKGMKGCDKFILNFGWAAEEDTACLVQPIKRGSRILTLKTSLRWKGREGHAVIEVDGERESMMSSISAKGQEASLPLKGKSSANGDGEAAHSDGESMEEEVEFNWEEFLEELGASAAPHTSFKHVEISLQSSFQPGMKLEVANKSNPDTYWVATIITTCGQLLLLRFSGYGEDRKADFWCDITTADLHPIGWCAQNNKVLMPPEDNVYLRKAIKEKYSDWTEFLIQELTGSRTAPTTLLEGPLKGKNTVDLITEGSVMELQDRHDPSSTGPYG
ncbi:hypothetical protein GJAV_G00158100 [Gymnothorax javanicus]|nr:hypothetical protein GJAV_G00158100 [Gymnothorax javanicus]